jgi:predicted  nucleic acid-binding Zn-ribbon protein
MKQKPVDKVASADEARQLAIDWQNWQSQRSMSMGEVVEWQGYFEKLASKFPDLTEEFRENAII